MSDLAVDQQDTSQPDTTEIAPLISAISGGGPQANIAASKLINKKIEDDIQGHINTQTQWAPLVVNLLAGNMGSVLKYWNGGPTREVEAYGPSGEKYVKEYNDRGPTGRLFTAEGKPVSPDQIKELDKIGLISKQDLTAAQKGEFQSGVANQTALGEAERKPYLEAYQNAQKAATTSAGIANLYSERLHLSKNADWLNAVQQLTPEQRSDLFKVISEQANKSSGQTKESGTSGSATATALTSSGENKGVNFEGGFGVAPGGSGGGVAPGGMKGPKLSGGTTAATNTLAQGTTVGGAGATSQKGSTESEGTQKQTNLRSQLEGILQMQLKDKDFSDMQRYVQLSKMIDESNSTRKTDQIVPGVSPIPSQDYLLTGKQNSGLADAQGIKNEALTAAWNKFYAQKIHKANGKPFNVGEASSEFLQTPVAQGINNRFDYLMAKIRGENPKLADGTIVVDNNNVPQVMKNGKAVYPNGR